MPPSPARESLRRARDALRGRLGGIRAASPEAPIGTTLDSLIPAEITDDPFAQAIETVAATRGVGEILEIGSSSGDGSTAAWVRGALQNPTRPRLHCIEVSTERYVQLTEHWRESEFVHCYNLSSVPLEQFPSAEDVERFYREVPSKLREFDLETVLGWLAQDVEYLRDHGRSVAGIDEIKDEHGIELFDAVLIDGSEFTGSAELDAVFGARFLLLDDTETFKNWANARRLREDPGYELVEADPGLRNGFAVFERVA